MARRARTPRPPRTLERALVTPEGVTLRLTLGGAGARAGAFVIDAIIILSVLIALTLLVVVMFFGMQGQASSVMAIIWLLGFFALRNFYFLFFETGRRAATWGKRVFRLRVVSRDGGRLTGAAVMARNLLREIEVFLPLSFLGVAAAEGTVDRWIGWMGFGWAAIFLFFPLLNRDRMRAGDLVAGTWVVIDERRKIGADLLVQDVHAPAFQPFTPADLAAYGQYELHRLEDVLRRDDRHDITTVAAAIRRKLGRPDERHDRAFLEAYYAALRAELERKLLFGTRKKDKFDAG